MVVKEGNLGNSDIILSSNSSFIVFSLNTKTKPGENFKFIKAEMFVDMGLSIDCKTVTLFVSKSRRVTRILQAIVRPVLKRDK